jgi:hypothetical protein
MHGASNHLIDVEEFSEAELTTLRAHYQRLVGLASENGRLIDSHSVEEADGGTPSGGLTLLLIIIVLTLTRGAP